MPHTLWDLMAESGVANIYKPNLFQRVHRPGSRVCRGVTSKNNCAATIAAVTVSAVIFGSHAAEDFLVQGWPNYGPANTCTFFSSTTFPTVYSSATGLADACHVTRAVSVPVVARQSPIRPSVKKFGHPCFNDYRIRATCGRIAPWKTMQSRTTCAQTKCTFKNSSKLAPFKNSSKLAPFKNSSKLAPFKNSSKLAPFSAFEQALACTRLNRALPTKHQHRKNIE